MRRLIFFALMLFSSIIFGQEIQCNVVVNALKVQDLDPSIATNMETSIREFINNRKWTKDKFKQEEKIDASFLITLNSRAENNYSASIQVSSNRPVYGTNYSTNMFVVNDEDFDFTYVDQQALDFNLVSFQSNLTSVLAFYVYVILGIDYDSFSPEGGQEFYQNAFEIVNQASTSGGSGWKAADGDNNRYWLVENLTNQAFKPFRSMLYQYHRLGLDQMKKDIQLGESEVYKSIESLLTVHKVRPSSFLLQVYFNAKSDELVKIFINAEPQVKSKIVPWLILIDPGNTKKYNTILEG